MDSQQLSDREIDILKLVAQAKSNKEIAVELFISVNTVKVHLANIFQKIGVASRTEAALYAIRNKIVDSPLMENSSSWNKLQGELVIIPSQTVQPSIVRNKWYLLALGLSLVLIFVSIYYLNNQSKAANLISLQETMQSTRWQELGTLPSPRKYSAVSLLNSNLYLIGGVLGESVSNLVESYNLNTAEWFSHSQKPTATSNTKAVGINGKIFVPGGKKGSGEAANCLEVYDPRTDQWVAKTPLPFAVYDAGIFGYEGMLYLIGGVKSEGISKSVLKYDTSVDKWIELLPLVAPRAGSETIILADEVLIIGGYDSGGYVSSVISYRPNIEGTGSSPWEQKSDFPSIGNIVGANVVGSIPIAMTRDSVWQYYPGDDSWVLFSSRLGSIDEGSVTAGSDMFLYLINPQPSKLHPSGQLLRFQVLFTLVLPAISD